MKQQQSKAKIETAINSVTNDGFKAVYSLLDEIVIRMEKDVLDMDLNARSFAHLGVAKSKYDGAKLIVNRFKRTISEALQKSGLDED